jgi:hypothetical protein
VLIGALAVVPVISTLSYRAKDVLLAGLWALSLSIVLGLADDVWGTYEHAAFLIAILVVVVGSIVATAVLENALDPTSYPLSTVEPEVPGSSTL